MKALIAGLLVLCLSFAASGAVVYEQPANPAGGAYKSSWYAPDGLNNDEYTWDAFTLAVATGITEIHWRGCYPNSPSGRTPVYAFTVAIYRSIPTGGQPDLGTGGRLVRYTINSNAGEIATDTINGVQVYDYAHTLTTPFQAEAGVKYWVQIEASQGLVPVTVWPDWSLCRGTGGDGSHFRKVGGTGGTYASLTGDLAFSLYSSDAPSATITASVLPAGAGTILGSGVYPIGSTASLTATPSAGFGFINWTENGTQVSTNPHYTFTTSVNRTLVANFGAAFTITTASYPVYGGTTTGSGIYVEGAPVTVAATPRAGFVFDGWSDGSMDQSHVFPASSDMILTAFFVSEPLSVTFDLDNAPAMTSLPLDLTVNGLSAHFSGGYSIQSAGTMGFTPAGFSGLCLYPSSVFASDLTVSFSETLTAFSILYSPQELGCDNSATMRVTAFLGGTQVGTSTTTAPVPGTWPTGTLAISVPGGFNSVVVHYDARPPTCQDYGVIFLADIMTVTRPCSTPSIGVQPVAIETCPWGGAMFSVEASGLGLGFQWERETAPNSGTFVALADGPTGSWDGGAPGAGGIVSGALTAALAIDADTASGLSLTSAHAVAYRCVVVSVGGSCGTVVSDAAHLRVCPADFDCSGGLAVADIFAFLNAWFQGDPHADFNGGGLAVQDIFDYLNAWFTGCP